jgi:hypothetical protein
MSDPNFKALLRKERIVGLDKDIRLMTTDELRRHFGAASSGRIVHTRVIKNIVWQVVGRVRRGELEGVDGNLRSFFYRFVKPVFARLPGALDSGHDPYETMLDVFVELVGEHKLLSYWELDLTDDNWQHRRLGERHPEVLVFAEKVGFFRWLLRLHERFSVTVLALGGAPSLLSSEYLVRLLQTEAGLEGGVHLFGVTDHDPSGRALSEAFATQLEGFGLVVETFEHLIGPEHFSAQELEIFAFPVPRRQKTLNRRWLEAGGGIGGKLLGLESDAMPKSRLTALVQERLAKLGVEPVEEDRP